jgi:hypothetical protein
MNPRTDPVVTAGRRWRTACLATVVLVVLGAGLTGCSVVRQVKNIVQAVKGNKATIDSFTTKLQSAQPPNFEATYTTTGSAPATIVYAVEAPKGLSFTDTPSGGGNPTSVDIIVNASGEYSCAAGSPPQCQRVQPANQATENQIFDFYTPDHWVTFLRDFSIAAGFAGDKVSSSSMKVNGFAMSCVDFVASGVAGASTICTTTQGILGYVRVASDATSFEITQFSTSPSSSLFELPPGAKVTTVQTPTTTT